MNEQNWVNEARAHWKEFLPNQYREFEEAGILDKALPGSRDGPRPRIACRGAP